MIMKKLFFAVLLTFILVSCKTTQQYAPNYQWRDVAVLEDSEIFVDPQSITSNGSGYYARVKTVYSSVNSRQDYLKNIQSAYEKSGGNIDKKMDKWSDFKYSITYGFYDCMNKRFKILEVADYTSAGLQIVKTKTKEPEARWLNVDTNTVGDHILFFVCDYGSN